MDLENHPRRRKARATHSLYRTKEKLSTDAPCGIAVSAAGDLVVSQMGEINVPADSLLCFYDPKTGALKSQLKTGLHDLVSIAYSKKTGKLYGVDFALDGSPQGSTRGNGGRR